jgi:hypothetical protein
MSDRDKIRVCETTFRAYPQIELMRRHIDRHRSKLGLWIQLSSVGLAAHLDYIIFRVV